MKYLIYSIVLTLLAGYWAYDFVSQSKAKFDKVIKDCIERDSLHQEIWAQYNILADSLRSRNRRLSDENMRLRIRNLVLEITAEKGNN